MGRGRVCVGGLFLPRIKYIYMYILYTHHNFFSQLQQFFNNFYMGNDFDNYFFRKIFTVSFVACEAL